jgi:hypothetical protein
MRPTAARGVVALCALVSALVPTAGRADARTASPPALDVQAYPLQNPDPTTGPKVFVADDGVWSASMSGDEVHRVDPAAGPLVGYLTPRVGPYVGGQMADGVLWTVVVDPNGAPCGSPRPEENPDAPYVLRGIDAATGSPAALVPLGWCQWKPSRTLGGSPFVSAHGGAVWVSRELPAEGGRDVGAQSVRVDATTGAITPVASPDPFLAFAGVDGGAWGMAFSASDSTENGYYGMLGTHPLARVGPDGSVQEADALHGAYWNPDTLAADRDGVWAASATRPPRPGGTLDAILTRVATTGRITTVPTVHPWNVVSGDDGHTWFLGTTHRLARTSASRPLDWVLGRVDTRTGKHLRTYHLDLPEQAGTIDDIGLVWLLADTGGAVWLRAGKAAGTLVRVTEPTR